jgi:hypothetical protein
LKAIIIAQRRESVSSGENGSEQKINGIRKAAWRRKLMKIVSGKNGNRQAAK